MLLPVLFDSISFARQHIHTSKRKKWSTCSIFCHGFCNCVSIWWSNMAVVYRNHWNGVGFHLCIAKKCVYTRVRDTFHSHRQIHSTYKHTYNVKTEMDSLYNDGKAHPNRFVEISSKHENVAKKKLSESEWEKERKWIGTIRKRIFLMSISRMAHIYHKFHRNFCFLLSWGNKQLIAHP